MNRTAPTELLDITDSIRNWLNQVNNMKANADGNIMSYSFGSIRMGAYKAREDAAKALTHLKTLDEQYELTPELEKLLSDLGVRIGSFIPLLDNQNLDEEIKAYCLEAAHSSRETDVLADTYAYFGYRSHKHLDPQAKLKELNDFN